MKRKSTGKRIRNIILSLLIIGLGLILGISFAVQGSTYRQILSVDTPYEGESADFILVLGCEVYSDGTPSPMLRDRLDRAVGLYEDGAAPKLLMSGDHQTDSYNEVDAMKAYAVEHGVPEEDILTDGSGLSTFDSLYRAREVYNGKNIIIVTQKYHLYRALYIANRLGMDATGAACDYEVYSGQIMRDLREILARDKDFMKTLFI
jgi:SanA protein